MSNIDKIKDYLKENDIQLDEKYLKFLEYIGGDEDSLKLKDSDEYTHSFPSYLPNWSESWYFNFIDENAGVDWVSRISYNPFDKKSNVLSVLFIDDEPNVYVNRLKMDEIPEDQWNLDKKLKYEIIKPHSEWNLKFEDRKFNLDLNWKARFDPFSYLEGIDILEYLDDYIDLIGKASQQHYEQGGFVKGTLRLKKKDKVREIDCFGHRDHSWGVREWQAVDKWNWISAQFPDKTINIAKVIVGDNTLVSGFIANESGTIRIKDVEIKTQFLEYEDKFGSKRKRPEKSRFEITDINDKKYTINSKRRTSIDLPVPIPSKIKTVISEQVHNFSLNSSEFSGNGISEYLYKY